MGNTSPREEDGSSNLESQLVPTQKHHIIEYLMTAQKHGDFQEGHITEEKHLFILSACHKRNSA
jgi:hypothetical protein